MHLCLGHPNGQRRPWDDQCVEEEGRHQQAAWQEFRDIYLFIEVKSHLFANFIIIRDRADIVGRSPCCNCWLFFVSFVLLPVQLPFWGPEHIPKFKKFGMHIGIAEKCYKFAHFRGFAFGHTHQRHLQVFRPHNTHRNSN